MSEWSALPNARHIDWVIESLKTHLEIWSSDRAALWAAARFATWNDAALAARSAGRFAAWHAAWNAAWDAALDADCRAVGNFPISAAARTCSRCAILALVAYDDCDQYLSMSADELRAWALVTEHPTAVLLLPMVMVRERLLELETV